MYGELIHCSTVMPCTALAVRRSPAHDVDATGEHQHVSIVMSSQHQCPGQHRGHSISAVVVVHYSHSALVLVLLGVLVLVPLVLIRGSFSSSSTTKCATSTSISAN